MNTWRRSRAIPALAATAVGFVFAAAALVASLGGASAVTSSSPSAAVTLTVVGSTTGLTDGSTVTFHVDTTGGTTLNGAITSRICSSGPLIANSADFGFVNGTRCVKPGGIFEGALAGADYTKNQGTFAGATTSDSRSHLVGTGTVAWQNDSLDVGSLTCDASTSCDLVVSVNINVSPSVVFFTQPLTFAGEETSSTTTSSTTTSTSTTTTSTTTTTTVPPSSTTTTLGTTTTTVLPTDGSTMSTTQGVPGSSFSVESSGWKPESTVGATFNSDPVDLGDMVADTDGTVHGVFAVPNVAPGAHTVKLVGVDESDEERTVSMSFTVVASPGTATTLSPSNPVSSSSGVSGPLAFTGAGTRDLLSFAVLLLAAGCLMLDVSLRRRALDR